MKTRWPWTSRRRAEAAAAEWKTALESTQRALSAEVMNGTEVRAALDRDRAFWRALAIALVRRSGERVRIDVDFVRQTSERFTLRVKEIAATRLDPAQLRLELSWNDREDRIESATQPEAAAQA